jgi:hypothetical protein
MCKINGFSYPRLPAAMQQLDALYRSGAGKIDQGVPPETSVFQFRKILKGILGSDTRDAFLSTLIPPGQVEDDAALPGAGGEARFLGGYASLEVSPQAVSGNPSVHAAAVYSLPVGAGFTNLDFNSIYAFTPAIAFSRPVTLRIKYDPSLLYPPVPEETLKLYELVHDKWQAVPGARVDTFHSEIVAPVTLQPPAGPGGTVGGGRCGRRGLVGPGAGGSNFRTSPDPQRRPRFFGGSLIFHAPGNPADGHSVRTRSGTARPPFDDVLAAFGATGLEASRSRHRRSGAGDVGAKSSATRARPGRGLSEGSQGIVGSRRGDVAVLLAPPTLWRTLQRRRPPLPEGVTLSITVGMPRGRSSPRGRAFREPRSIRKRGGVRSGIVYSGNKASRSPSRRGGRVYGVAVDNRTNDVLPGGRVLARPRSAGSVEYVPHRQVARELHGIISGPPSRSTTRRRRRSRENCSSIRRGGRPRPPIPRSRTRSPPDRRSPTPTSFRRWGRPVSARST